MRLAPETVVAEALENAPGCWYVWGKTPEGVAYYHNGPVKVDYFTEEEARHLARRVQAANGEINLEHWYTDDGYSTEQRFADLYEWEEMEKLAGRW